MTRVRLLTALAVVAAVLAVATLAGGFDRGGQGEPQSGLGVGDEPGVGMGDEGGTGFSISGESWSIQLPEWVVTGPLQVVLWASLTFFVVFLGHTLVTGRLDTLWRTLQRATVDFVAVALLLVGTIALLLAFARLLGAGGGGAGGPSAATSSTVEGTASVFVPSASLVSGVALVLGLFAAVVAIAALGSARSDDENATEAISAPYAPAEDRDVDPLGLGDAVDGVPMARQSNEVYRAWAALRASVGADRESTASPASVERRAVDAGFNADAVGELTRLFCAVRYGPRAPTPAMERRAATLAERLDLVTTPDDGDAG